MNDALDVSDRSQSLLFYMYCSVTVIKLYCDTFSCACFE